MGPSDLQSYGGGAKPTYDHEMDLGDFPQKLLILQGLTVPEDG